MLKEDFTSVMQASSRDELLAKIVGFTKRLGFDTVSATVVQDHANAESEFTTIDNTPAAYRTQFDDFEKGRSDPVMQHCRRRGTPIIWNQQTYVAAGQGDKWEAQAPFGYRHGIALALHLPEGRHFSLGVDRDQALPADSAELTRLTADLQLFAVHAQEAALRLLTDKTAQQSIAFTLTSRELECLRWTMNGKTAWELGRILGISEHTAIRHISRATHKLGAVNKHQAVLTALRMRLIG